jgi:hypothetical protein
MEFAPAAWTIEPDADRQEIEDLVSRLAERMDIATPEIKGDVVLLPANYIAVSRALSEVDPAWEEKGLTPPTP